MLTPGLLIVIVVALSMLMMVHYKKTIPIIDMDLFVDLKNDIIRESSISFPKSRLEIPGLTKWIVTQSICKNGHEDGAISNDLCCKSARARSPTQFNKIGNLNRC